MALETVQNIIDDARYDLRDLRSTNYSDSELLSYFRRAVKLLDAELIRMDSDLVQSTDERSLPEDENHITLPSTTVSVNEVWTSGQNEAEKISLSDLKYERRFSSSGEPAYWALSGLEVWFEKDADQQYTITSEIVCRSAVLGLTDDAPYNDRFNEPLRQAVVLMAKNRQDFDVGGSALVQKMFSDAAFSHIIRRGHKPKRYKKDW